MSFRLSRTSLLILDYKQFRAAQRIQSYWRKYYAKKADISTAAAVIIQRWWRGFSLRRAFVQLIEERLQQRLWDHYNRSANKIQALFRGWFVRQTVHNAYSLRRMQLCAAEELLTCVAYKLHHLLRTYSIPGVYSLRNSNCLSKVEKLLTSSTFRFHNDRARFYQCQMANQNESRKIQFNLNKFQTEVPYAGPNFYGACKMYCEPNPFTTHYMDSRMYKIIEEYEDSKLDQRMKNTHRKIADRKLRNHVEKIFSRKLHTHRDFCGDVIDSMRKWKIWNDNNFIVNDFIFRTPEMLSSFLDEAARLLEEVNNVTCHCQVKVFDVIGCH